ncbi:Oxygen-dependent choline dehydrogenase [Pseudocercospora fuligena]|uniref:Oxygen-dependent choline dehydrogenase n=1 Tax=Pseudocercospora fuligena TaxID=685502 RepID=A0A8H6RA72_9PEZI|nr:Oxygen-dependent choline dehydrogenase [Pseudocercospora fuligena]
MSYRCPDRIYTGLYPYQGCVPLGVLYPRAGTLGGCTQHHAMIMVHPWESDFDNIATITGNSSWSAQTMRQYFVRLERNQYLPSSVVGHGYSGWLHITVTALTLVAEDLKLASLVVAAATALGKNLIEGLLTTVTGLAHIFATDFNAPGRTRDAEADLWQVPIAVDPTDSTRSGTRRFVVETAQQYPNLHVQMNTFVTKLLLDTSGYRPRAYGVQYEVGQSLYSADPRWTGARGQPDYAFAIREVILSAGSFETPKLLMLSGIGPPEELSRHGIQTIVSSPGVGRNMQDRYEYGVVGKTPTPFSSTKDCTFNYRQPDPCLQQWMNSATPALKGVYGSNGLALAVTLRSSVAAQSEPDVYISGAPAYFQGYYPNYASEAVADPMHWTWIILKAQSRNNAGTVTLRSTNPFDMPEIQFNSLAIGGNEDVQAVMDAVDFGRRAFGSLIPLGGDGFTENDPEKAADVITGRAPDPYFATPDAGGLLGTLGFGLVGGLVSGLTGQGESLGTNANPEGLLGSPANLLGGLGLFDNNQPTGDNPPSQ